MKAVPLIEDEHDRPAIVTRSTKRQLRTLPMMAGRSKPKRSILR